MDRFMSMVVVPFGQAKNIVRAAYEAGAAEATILHARGVQKTEKEGLFQFKIEPEQEIVLIMATKEVTNSISERILKDYTSASRKGSIYILPIKGIEEFAV